jgi:hypothetical protein
LIIDLQLTNFRKFTSFHLRIRKGNILVGPNNAGKSSVLDAFRLLEACYRHSRTRNPSLIQIEGRNVFYGYEIPDTVLPFSLANIACNYSGEDAILDFEHSNKTHAYIRLNPDRPTKFYLDVGGRPSTSSKFRRAFPIDLIIIPTLAPLEAEEVWVRDETVQRNATTRLASRVLRNIWLRRTDDEFDDFRLDIERAWPNIRLKKPEIWRSSPPIVEMYYSEDRNDREVRCSGFGFQVWMQIQTHLRRATPQSILIIDEPDIYLHPDLQHRLLRNVRNRFSQFVMATHSVEIINDAEPDEIVAINPQYRSGRRIRTEEEFSELYHYLGSTDNADFARIARARKVIFVEGKDGRLLRRLASRLRFEDLANPQGTPVVSLGGFSQWRRAIDAVWAFERILDLKIEAFCLFDRDYRCDDEITKFLNDCRSERVQPAVLERKEIENYLLVPDAIGRVVDRRLASRGGNIATSVGREDMVGWLRDLTDEFRFKVMTRLEGSVLESAQSSRLDRNTIAERFHTQFARQWAELDYRLARGPGKDIFSRLNNFLLSELKISITEPMVVSELTLSNVDPFLLGLLQRLNVFCAD